MEPIAIAILDGGAKALGLLKDAIELMSKIQSKERKLFTKYIQPGFSDLRPLLRQYVINIAEYRQAISSSDDYADLISAYRSFTKNRISIVIERQEKFGTLDASVKELRRHFEKHPRKKKRATKLIVFFESIRDFFRFTRFAEGAMFTPDELVHSSGDEELWNRTNWDSSATGLIERTCVVLDLIKDEGWSLDRAKKDLDDFCSGTITEMEGRLSKAKRSVH